jgi:uncharacterized protein (DUF433 family)
MAWYDAYIVTTPGAQGGYPVLRETRTPVRTIATLVQSSGGSRQAVRDALPHLSDEQIDAALDFYRDNPTIIDVDITRQEAALNAFLARR